MKINQSNINFQSRNPNIRQADRICRMVNSIIPTSSPTKIIGEGLIRQDADIYNYGKFAQKKLVQMVRDPGFNFEDRTSPEYFKFFLSALKKTKLSNCGERARFASLICAVNGIESKIASLWTIAKKKLVLGEDLDHAILVISPSEERFNCDILPNMHDKIIIDPWLGIADYGNNANLEIRKYFERFKDVDKSLSNFDSMHLALFSKEIITTENTQKLREAFPEFIIDKK